MPVNVRTYQEEMHNSVGFFATWLPGDILDLGDVGELKDGQFRKRASLKDLGIEHKLSSRGPAQDLEVTSKGGVEVVVEGGIAGAVLPVTALIKVEFKHRGAFVFNATDVRKQVLEHSEDMAKAILDAHKANKWKRNWCIVDSVHLAGCATVLIAENRLAGVTFEASTELPLGNLPLANPNVKLKITSSRGKLVQVLGARDLRPLYSCIKLDRKWWAGPELAKVRGSGPSESPFTRLDIGDLWDAAPLDE
jgi:hypothetical protein